MSRSEEDVLAGVDRERRIDRAAVAITASLVRTFATEVMRARMEHTIDEHVATIVKRAYDIAESLEAEREHRWKRGWEHGIESSLPAEKDPRR